MTALQDWLSTRPTVDPKAVKAMICEVLRARSTDETAPVADPPLMGRGLERC